MQEIKKIESFSLAKIAAIIYGLIGFFVALAVAIVTIVNILRQSDFSGSAFLVALFNLGAGILVGLVVAAIMAVLGWIFGFIVSAFYNLFVARSGGIKIELREVEKKEQQQINLN